MTTHVSSLEELSKTLDNVTDVTYDYSNDVNHKLWKAIIPVTTGCGNEDIKCLSYTKGVFKTIVNGVPQYKESGTLFGRWQPKSSSVTVTPISTPTSNTAISDATHDLVEAKLTTAVHDTVLGENNVLSSEDAVYEQAAEGAVVGSVLGKGLKEGTHLAASGARSILSTRWGQNALNYFNSSAKKPHDMKVNTDFSIDCQPTITDEKGRKDTFNLKGRLAKIIKLISPTETSTHDYFLFFKIDTKFSENNNHQPNINHLSPAERVICKYLEYLIIPINGSQWLYIESANGGGRYRRTRRKRKSKKRRSRGRKIKK